MTPSGLLPEARILVVPDGIVASEFPAIEATVTTFGLGLDPWQRKAARLIAALDADGLYAADTVVLSIPRQVGKTFLIALIIFADSIIHPGTTTVWTAHRFKVARETFNELKGIANLPALAAHIDAEKITTAAGNECIPFLNGSRIMFAARERGSIRGFTKVRRLILDEAQILTEAVLADLTPTMNHAENPQIIMMGTPPKPNDPGEAFTGLRLDAIEGESAGVLYAELSAEDECDLDDEAAWLAANPSLHVRTPVKAIRRLRKLLSDADFAREALGIWAAAGTSVIDWSRWMACCDPKSQPVDPVAFAVDVTPDRARTTIAIAGRRADGLVHIEVPFNHSGTGWVLGQVAELVTKWKPCAVALDPAGPAGSFIEPLREAGIEVVQVAGRQLTQACGGFYDDAVEGALRHRDEPELNAAVTAARKRPLGDAWAWHRKDSTDISPLVAVTLARFALLANHEPAMAEPEVITL